MSKEPLTLGDDGVLRVPAIEVQEVILRNKAGQVLGSVFADESGTAIAMSDKTGAIRINFAVSLDGSEAGVVVSDKDGRPQIGLYSEDGTPFITIKNPEGAMAMAVSMQGTMPVIHANEHKLPLHEILAALAQVAQARQPNASQN